MSEPNKAVFLSYASQDKEAAKRIADALQAAGVEVWFDLSELRGGDAWDAKIRKQIRECALFVPIVSATTNVRLEGYFRLEWKLAVDRSHTLAHDHPFLFPVVIGEVDDASARVPDAFRDVQWSRMDLRETPASLAVRISKLLSGDRGILEAAAQQVAMRTDRRGPVWLRYAFPTAALLVALGFLVQSFRNRSPAAVPPAATPAVQQPNPIRGDPNRAGPNRGGGPGGRGDFRRGGPPGGARGPSEARQLVEKARAIYEPWNGTTREDFALAEDLLKRATELDPSDAEAWAAYGILNCGFIGLGYDRNSDSRRELARSATERAITLAPTSVQARIAQAMFLRLQDSTLPEAESVLRGVLTESPNERFALITLAVILRLQGKPDDALVVLDRAIALPGNDPVAHYNRYLVLRGAGRNAEAEAALDEGLAEQPEPFLYRAKVEVLTTERGDLDGAAEILAKVSPSFLLEDTSAFVSTQLWLWRRDTEKALAVLRTFPREIIECSQFLGPKAFLVGEAHRIAGRTAAAETEWRAALTVAERELAAEPNDVQWLSWRALLLASLGETTEAEDALRAVQQLGTGQARDLQIRQTALLVGRRSEVITYFERNSTFGSATQRAMLLNSLRFDPAWDSIRSDPAIQRLLGK